MDGLFHLLDFTEECPFRPVDWRWKRAEVLRAEAIAPSERRDGRWVARAVQFQAALAQATTEAARAALAERDPAVALAYRLWAQGEHPVRWHLEARLLTGEPHATIAARCRVDEAAVAAYDALFFNVTGRLDC